MSFLGEAGESDRAFRFMTAASPHIIIVGAGLIGLSCADSLLSDGATVTLLDARPGPVRGASFANSGMIHPSQSGGWVRSGGEADLSDAVHDFAMSSRDMLMSRMESLGLDTMRARSRGCYQIHDNMDAAMRAQADYERVGVRANPVTDPVATFGRPALYFPDDRSADARAYGMALSDAVQAAGATLITNAAEVRLDRIGGERIGVRLGTHRFHADHIVIACGAQSSALLKQLALSLAVEPNRGWAADFSVPETLALPNVPVMDAVSRSAFTPFRNRIRVSGTLGEDTAKPLLARWSEILPISLQSLGPPLQLWSGLRPMSKTGAPIIDRVADGLWVNTGHAHMGWTLCAASGRLLADLIAGRRAKTPFAYRAAPQVSAA